VDAGSWGEDDSPVEVPDNTPAEVPDTPEIEGGDYAPVAQADQAGFGDDGIPADVRQIPGGALSATFNPVAERPAEIPENPPDDGSSGNGDPETPDSPDLTPGRQSNIFRGTGGPA
jgi:hypothetical protein